MWQSWSEWYHAQKYNFNYQELHFEGRSWKLAESERAGALKNSGRSLASKFELPQEMTVWPGRCWFFPTKIFATKKTSGFVSIRKKSSSRFES
jgi:hypothetical protein